MFKVIEYEIYYPSPFSIRKFSLANSLKQQKHPPFSSGPFWFSNDLFCFSIRWSLLPPHLSLSLSSLQSSWEKQKQKPVLISLFTWQVHLSSFWCIVLYGNLFCILPASDTCFFAVILPWIFVEHLRFLEYRSKYSICDIRYVWEFNVCRWTASYWVIWKCWIGDMCKTW